MLSPKSAQILVASGTFGQTERDLWLPLLVGSRLYKKSPQNFTDVESRLAEIADASTKAKQMNATLVLIDKIGPVDASTSGADNYSTLENREGLLEYALSVLYGNAFQPRTGAPGSLSVRTHPVW